MKQLSITRSKARSFSWHGFLKRLSGANGAIDLASIMVGVIVIGVVAGVISATVGAVIPWSQDQAAKGNLDAVAVAEATSRTADGAYFAYDSHPDSEYQAAENSWLQRPEHRLVIETSDNGMSWLAVTKSASGKIFVRTSASPEVYEAEDQGYLVASGYGVRTVGLRSFAVPAGLNDQLLSTGITEATAQEAVTAVSDGNAFTFKSTSKLGYGPGITAAALPEAPEVSARMVSTWDTTLAAGDPVITLPIHGAMDATIDWGDGTVEPATAMASHAYAEPGVKTVAIDGTFKGWGAYFGWTPNRLTAVTKWSGTETTDLSKAFHGATNLTEVISVPSGVTDMSSMFSMASSFNQPLAFDTSKVTNMSEMFYDASSFNQPLAFDTSKVTDMNYMFSMASSFNQPLAFDTSKVATMNGMFHDAPSFNQPLTFDTSNVTDMGFMFKDALTFNRPLAFDTSSVTAMEWMFNNAAAFNQDIRGWNTSGVQTMTDMFGRAWAFNQDISGWNVSNVWDIPDAGFFNGGGFAWGGLPEYNPFY